jgi:hypothetical protein
MVCTCKLSYCLLKLDIYLLSFYFLIKKGEKLKIKLYLDCMSMYARVVQRQLSSILVMSCPCLSVAFSFDNPQIVHQADPTTVARYMEFPRF